MMTLETLGRTVLALACLTVFTARGAETPLENELESLAVPANQAPAAVSQEKLYAVQSRFAPLRHEHEVSVGGANNFTSDSFLSTQQIDAGYRFYFSDRWFATANASVVFNKFTDAATRVIERDKLVPDVAYAKFRTDAMVGFQPFYGKFRLTMDQVFYFDQYIALGAGLVGLNTGNVGAVVADVGFAFRFGRSWSFRIGMKDYFFEEKRVLSKSWAHNLLGHLDVAVVL